ncbi:MAG TPA: hypothetical protein VKB30_05760 [Candidatus Limnocylindrales bacterium]|nr:hypothetical protein [Candidatus Limnocylindrales bacterium]
MTTNRARPVPGEAVPRPRPSEERARLAEEGRTTRRIAIAAVVVALLGLGLVAARAIVPAASSCQQASWDVRPEVSDLPPGYTLSASQFDINRQQVTFLGPLPADETTSQGVVYVTVTCFDEGASDAVARSEQAARDADQAVTPRPDLGDGGFSATDEGGSTFIQLRHGDVVVYLAGSAQVDPRDIDSIASAYDKALGGDGGAVAVGTLDPGVDAPSDEISSQAPSDAPPSDAAAAPELEARLPDKVGDTILTVDSVVGTDVLGEDSSSRAIAAALRAEGKTPADLTLAQAYDESQAVDLSMLAFAIEDLTEAKTRQIVVDSWLSASGAGVTRQDVELGGRTVTRIDYGDDGAKDYVVSDGRAVIVITAADEALATAAIKALP